MELSYKKINKLFCIMTSFFAILFVVLIILLFDQINSKRNDPSNRNDHKFHRKLDFRFTVNNPPFHFVDLIWPKAYGRIFTMEQGIEGENENPRRRRRGGRGRQLPFSRWAMRLSGLDWLVGSFFAEPAVGLPVEDNPHFNQTNLTAIMDSVVADTYIYSRWLFSSLAPNADVARDDLQLVWESKGRESGLPPDAFFHLGAEFADRLTIGQWLADGGVTPSNWVRYNRDVVEGILRERLGSLTYFRLFCYWFPEYDPPVENFPGGVRFRPPRPYMLFAVRVCFEGVLADQLADCQDRIVLDAASLIDGLEPCDEFFHYYRTI